MQTQHRLHAEVLLIGNEWAIFLRILLQKNEPGMQELHIPGIPMHNEPIGYKF